MHSSIKRPPGRLLTVFCFCTSRSFRNRSTNSPNSSPAQQGTSGESPRLTFNANVLSEQELEQALKDARTASQPIQIRDDNGEIKQKFLYPGEEDSEIEFNSDISSSTELETEIHKPIETRVTGTELRRSKRLTNAIPIIRLNNPMTHGFYRKRGGKAQLPGANRRGHGVVPTANHGSPEFASRQCGPPNTLKQSAVNRDSVMPASDNRQVITTTPEQLLRTCCSPGGGGNEEE